MKHEDGGDADNNKNPLNNHKRRGKNTERTGDPLKDLNHPHQNSTEIG